MTKRFAVAAAVLGAGHAHAGGLELPIQGVHAMERAGALVAGASDADALWLDPAGLASFAGKGTQGLAFDVAYLYQPVTYTPSDPTQGHVSNQQPGEPLPSLAGAVGLDDRWVVAGGLTWKYIPTSRYDPMGVQRYASNGLDGSQFVQLVAGVAYVVSPRLRVGATVQDLVTLLDLKLVASACPGAMTCDASYDLPLEVKETDAFAPSASVGVQYDALPELVLGATLQAPTSVSAAGALTLTAPAAPALRGMAITGTQATASFWLPPSARAGVEYHDGVLALEAAVDVELWSLHDSIAIAPDDVKLGTATLSAMAIARDYKTSVAVSLGGEVHLGHVQLGAGVAYETAAAPTADVSVLTVDAPKLILALGGGYAADGWQVGVAASFVHQADVDVTDPAVAELEPLRTAGAAPVYINGGTYHAFDVLAGLRMARKF